MRSKLDEKDDQLSVDCGGDCWGCIGEIEADMGDVYSPTKASKKFDKGLRPAWIDLSNKSSAEYKK